MGRRFRLQRVLAWNGPVVTLVALTIAVGAALLLIRLPPLQGAVFVALLAIVIGGLIEPFVGLGAALFVGPLKAYLSAEIPQIPAQIGHAFIALALASWLMRGMSARERPQPGTVDRIGTLSPLLLSLIVFFGAALLSLWDAVGLAAYGIPELIKWAELLLLVIFVKEHLAPSAARFRILPSPSEDARARLRRLDLLILALLGSGVFQAAVGIWQFGLRDEGPEHFRILGGDFFRAYGTFEQPNPYAGYVGLTAALALGVVMEATRGRWVDWFATRFGKKALTHPSSDPPSRQRIGLPLYLLSGGVLGTMLVALVASWSRGAWIGFAAAALTIGAAVPRRTLGSVLLVIVLVGGATGLHASGQLPASFTARLTEFVQDIRLEDVRGVPINDANYAVMERLAHWQAALSMFRNSLWTGVGFGSYEAAYPTFALVNWPFALGHAHNIYLNLAAETGVVGLVAYLLLWAVAFWQTWRVTRRARGLTRGLAIGLLGAFTHITVHHLLDNLYVNNVHLHIGVLLGLAVFIIQRTHQTS